MRRRPRTLPLARRDPAIRSRVVGQHRRRFLETRRTSDLKAPISVDDYEMDFSWRFVPLAPDNDPAWFIIDGSDEDTTIWGRFVEHDAEGQA